MYEIDEAQDCFESIKYYDSKDDLGISTNLVKKG